MRPRADGRVEKWFRANDSEIWLSTVVIAEISFGIERIRPDERSPRLDEKLADFCRHFAGRIAAFDEQSALVYGPLLGQAVRNGKTLSTPDGMIAAIALRHGAALATRNEKDFAGLGLEIVNPWR